MDDKTILVELVMEGDQVVEVRVRGRVVKPRLMEPNNERAWTILKRKYVQYELFES